MLFIINIFDGTINYIYLFNYSRATIYGGSFERNLNLSGNNEVDMYGGTINHQGYDEISLHGNSILTLYGLDFTVDGISVEYGEITSMSKETPSSIWKTGDRFRFSFELGDTYFILLPTQYQVLSGFLIQEVYTLLHFNKKN